MCTSVNFLKKVINPKYVRLRASLLAFSLPESLKVFIWVIWTFFPFL